MVTSISTSSSSETDQTVIAEKKKLSSCQIQPTLLEFGGSTFEYTVYKPSLRFLRDFDTIFPSLNSNQRKQLLVVPVIQKCEFDMVGLSKEVNYERDIKLELVINL